MSDRLPSPRPWYREAYVWLLIALPLSALLAGAVTLFLAIGNADTEVPRIEPAAGRPSQ